MKISERGLALIRVFEDCVLTAYKDSTGRLTIGYGHTSGVYKGQKITQAEADNFLKQDVAIAEMAVLKYNSKYHWNQNQFDALCSFAFNIGSINNLTKNGTRTIAQISEKIPEYKKAGGKVSSGLIKRRMAEKELFDKEV